MTKIEAFSKLTFILFLGALSWLLLGLVVLGAFEVWGMAFRLIF